MNLTQVRSTNKVKVFTFPSRHRGFVIPSPFMLMSGAALAFGITTIMFWRLYAATSADYSEFRARVEAEQEQIDRDHKRRITELTEINASLSTQYRLDLADLRNRPVRVLTNCDKGTVSSAPVTIERVDGTPKESVVITSQQCESVANDATADALKVIALQDYINNVCRPLK